MKTAYINGIILDGTEHMTPQTGMVLLVEDKHITSICDAAVADLAGCTVIDLKGRYLMPGLINLHVHLPGTGKPSKKQLNLERICKLVTSCELGARIGCSLGAKSAKTALMAGITTVRAVGGIADFDTRVRDEIQSGKRIGARILPANCAISVPGGHMAGTFAYIAKTPQEAVNCVDKIVGENPALIKLMITGGVMDCEKVGEPGVLRMPEEMIRAACDRAHALGFKVAAHCEGQAGVRAALKNGVDTIEHGAKPDAEIMELFHKTGACQVLTLTPALPYMLRLPGVMNLSDASAINSEAVVDGMVELAKACLKEGIPVGLGTDSSCSYATHYDLWRELRYYTKYCGVSNAFALYTATLLNARIAGVDHFTGSLEPGKMADMIVTERNPLDDLSALRNVSMVVFEGRAFDHPVVEKYAEVEEVLDTQQ